MTQSLAEPLATETKTPTASVSPASIALWLAIQLTAIILIVVRARFWIGGGNDSVALELMLIMQIAGAALLLPALLPNLRSMICIAVAAIPFLQIAAMIAAGDTKHALFGVLALMLWLIALQLAMSLTRSTLMRATVHAFAVCVSIGGVVLFYLRSEFFGVTYSPDAAWFGPICAALTLVRAESSWDQVLHAWIQLSLIALVFCVIVVAKKVFLIASARRA
ncbi:MAG: hypothetical protein H7Z14_10200 [Anaerolineae bacterium]|nr:hypothetical protein [Phycisphaerae bacterium]